MKDLEILLNSLIKMGWEPWGKDVDKITIPPKEEFNEDRCLFIDIKFSNGFSTYGSRRELISLESGLWQFVVENKLYKKTNIVYEKHFGIGEYKNFYDVHYQYRLLESALVPEEEMAQFLVDNIKVEGKKE